MFFLIFLGVCLILQFSTESITAFRDNSAAPFSTALLSPTEDTAWAVRNGNGAIYGKVLTDGVSGMFLFHPRDLLKTRI